jgi:hypothetical protein
MIHSSRFSTLYPRSGSYLDQTKRRVNASLFQSARGALQLQQLHRDRASSLEGSVASARRLDGWCIQMHPSTYLLGVLEPGPKIHICVCIAFGMPLTSFSTVFIMPNVIVSFMCWYFFARTAKGGCDHWQSGHGAPNVDSTLTVERQHTQADR